MTPESNRTGLVSTGTEAQFNVSAADQQLVGASASRVGLLVCNSATQAVTIGTTNPITAGLGIVLAANQVILLNADSVGGNLLAGAWHVRAAGASVITVYDVSSSSK